MEEDKGHTEAYGANQKFTAKDYYDSARRAAQNAYDECYKGAQQLREWLKSDNAPIKDKVELFFAFVIAAATTVYVCVAVAQWCMMRETQRQDKRAWVLFETVEPGPEPNPIAQLPLEDAVYQIDARNFGSGPATRVWLCAEITASEPGPGDEPTCPDDRKQVVPPSERAIARYRFTPLPAFDPKHPTKYHYAFGRIRYEDQFGEKHETVFCQAFRRSGADEIGPLKFGPCKHSNWAT